MDFLKKIWPYAFQVKKGDWKNFLIHLLILIVVCVVASLVLGLLGNLPVIGFIAGILGWLIDVYCTVDIILALLKVLDVIK